METINFTLPIIQGMAAKKSKRSAGKPAPKKKSRTSSRIKGLKNMEVLSDARSLKVSPDDASLKRSPSIEQLKKKYGGNSASVKSGKGSAKKKKAKPKKDVKALLVRQKNAGSDRLLGNRTVIVSGNEIIGSQG